MIRWLWIVVVAALVVAGCMPQRTREMTTHVRLQSPGTVPVNPLSYGQAAELREATVRGWAVGTNPLFFGEIWDPEPAVYVPYSRRQFVGAVPARERIARAGETHEAAGQPLWPTAWGSRTRTADGLWQAALGRLVQGDRPAQSQHVTPALAAACGGLAQYPDHTFAQAEWTLGDAVEGYRRIYLGRQAVFEEMRNQGTLVCDE